MNLPPSVRIASFDGVDVTVPEPEAKAMVSVSDFFDSLHGAFKRTGFDPSVVAKKSEISLHFPERIASAALREGTVIRSRKGVIANANEGSRIDRLALASAGLLAAKTTTVVRDTNGNVVEEIKPSRREVFKRFAKGTLLLGSVAFFGAALPDTAAAAICTTCPSAQCAQFNCIQNRPGEYYYCVKRFSCTSCTGSVCSNECTYRPSGC